MPRNVPEYRKLFTVRCLSIAELAVVERRNKRSIGRRWSVLCVSFNFLEFPLQFNNGFAISQVIKLFKLFWCDLISFSKFFGTETNELFFILKWPFCLPLKPMLNMQAFPSILLVQGCHWVLNQLLPPVTPITNLLLCE